MPDTLEPVGGGWLLGTNLGGFSAMLGGSGAVLGVMARGFHWL
jgi:hypothetical protein